MLEADWGEELVGRKVTHYDGLHATVMGWMESCVDLVLHDGTRYKVFKKGFLGGYRFYTESAPPQDTGAMKFDDDKISYALVPQEAVDELAKVLNFGAGKYTPHNWRKGLKYSRCYDAMLRHLFAWWGGEDIDKESGLSHLAHAMCCLSFLITYQTDGSEGLDDRRGKDDGSN